MSRCNRFLATLPSGTWTNTSAGHSARHSSSDLGSSVTCLATTAALVWRLNDDVPVQDLRPPPGLCVEVVTVDYHAPPLQRHASSRCSRFPGRECASWLP